MDISAYLEKHGISQEDFGKRISVSQSLVSQWITGKVAISPDSAKDIVSETDGEVTPYDCRPDLWPPGFKFPKSAAAGGNGRGGNGKKVAA